MTKPAFRVLYCCGCQREIHARLTDGREIYPHRPDLADRYFWKCDTCENYVGCHSDAARPASQPRPLGNIATSELRSVRDQIHRVLDPIWKSGRVTRGKLYKIVAKKLGVAKYHTAEIKTIEEAWQVYAIATGLAEQESNI